MSSTLLHRLASWAQEAPVSVAQRHKKDGAWRDITASELRDRVYQLALFLQARGFTSADVSAIFAPNSPEWVQVELAATLLGGKSAGLYPNSNPKDIRYILEHTRAKVLTVKNEEFFKKVISAEGHLPDGVELVLVMEGEGAIHPLAVGLSAAFVEGQRLAKAKGHKGFEALLNALDPLAPSFLIYTSGTTGAPKGAMLSQDNLCFTADRVIDFWEMPETGSLFSFLPLCHVAEKFQNLGVGISRRYMVSFATQFEKVAEELTEVQPTLLLSVPRLWEKMMEGVLAKVAHAPLPRRKLAEWALHAGARLAEKKYGGRLPSPRDLAEYAAANRLVLSKIRHALGLARADALASGAAALPSQVARWFRSVGLEIREDFGQTETTGVICMTQKGVESAGTVGRPVTGLEVKLAEDGEILTRGRHVFLGYFKDPKATEAAFKDGWLCTGDLGEIDSRGLMRIRGRKKEILKTSGGKMVAPLPIEERIKGGAPAISQICMVGDGRKFLSALVTLTETALAEIRARDAALLEGLTVEDGETVQRIREAIDAVNADLASYEQVKRFAVLPRDFSVVEDEMTLTLKMKRAVIEKHYSNVIDRLYE